MREVIQTDKIVRMLKKIIPYVVYFYVALNFSNDYTISIFSVFALTMLIMFNNQ